MSKKVIWITGGSSGIGFATAKYFLKNNWNVIISSSNIEKLTNAKNRIINDNNGPALIINQTGTENILDIQQNSNTVFYIENEGNVGIGTTSPKVPLHVVGQQSGSVGTYTQVARVRGGTASAGFTGPGGWFSNGLSEAISIMSNRLMVGEGFYAFSDNRIKTDISLINDNFALQQVNAIESKEYHYIDYARKKEVKTIGFIAQEVKDIIPNAVTLNNDFIPDEMSLIENPIWIDCSYNDYDEYGNTIVKNKWKLQIPDLDISSNNTGKCRFYFSNDPSGNDEMMKELTLDPSSNNTFEAIDERYNTVFFYGKEVNDFHILDKSQIFALHHSAIQELSRKNDTLQTENNELRSRLEALESAVLALQNNN